MCWGVRDMQRYQLLPVDHPMVQVEVGGELKESGYIVNPKKNPMFPIPIINLDVVSYLIIIMGPSFAYGLAVIYDTNDFIVPCVLFVLYLYYYNSIMCLVLVIDGKN